jgi:hypothetical protein
MAWPATEAEIDTLIGAYEQRGLLLQQVGQWPTTLPAFEALHGSVPQDLQSFAMRLSPISIGRDMVTDSAPHFISMLQAMAGPGDIESGSMDLAPEADRLTLNCRYRHALGSIDARLLLQTCEQRPRPAWYEINGLRAERVVTLPDYRQSLASDGTTVEFADPMQQVAANFIEGISRGEATDGAMLRSAHRNLLQLAAVWR